MVLMFSDGAKKRSADDMAEAQVSLVCSLST